MDFFLEYLFLCTTIYTALVAFVILLHIGEIIVKKIEGGNYEQDQ